MRFLCLFIFACGNAFNAIASTPDQYRFSLLDMNDGLSHNQVKCFLKDSNGFLWIGTANGLNRYNGYDLEVFTYDSKDTSSIVGNGINALFEDPEGNIWVQTNYGYSIYNPATDKFYKDRRYFLGQYDLPGNDIENIIKDAAGNFWFFNTGQGLTRYNPTSKTSVTLKHSSSDSSSLGSNYVSSFLQNSKGDFWIIHRNGILEKLDGNSLQIVERNYTISDQFNQELLVYGLTIDSDDDLWIYLPFDSRGIFHYDHTQKKTFHFHKSSAKYSLNNDLSRGIIEHSKGKIWIGTDHGGINVVDKETLKVDYILHNDEIAKSLVHNSINALYKDDEGIVWIGTVKNGVNYYHANSIRFPHFKNQSSLSNSLPFDDINAFVEDKEGNLWLGTNGGGLIYYNRVDERYKQFRSEGANKNSLSNDVIVSLMMDSKGILWIGTYMGGLNKFDGETFTHYKNDPTDPESLSDDSIWEIYEDSNGNLWIGTLKGGLELFDREKEVFYHSREGSGKFPLHCNYITAITEDRHGKIWVGGGYGIDVIDIGTGEVSYYGHDPQDSTSLISNNVLSIYNDSENNIWIGTTEGLSLFEEDKKRFKNFTKENGLPNNTIITILEDNQRNLWVSTSNGLSNMIIERKQNGKSATVAAFRNYDELDGLQGKAFNDNAACKLRSGELIFGGYNGFNLFHPESLSRNESIPRVVFTDFQLFNNSVAVGEQVNGRVLLAKSISEKQNIVLKHNENVFSVEFAALNYLHPEKNKYKYKLEGFDKDWLTTDGTHKVTYTNLDPGNYKLRVIASNNDGLWNNTGTALHMTVLAPFWQTAEAYTLYTLFIVGALFFIRQSMIRRERKNFLIEQERRDARKMHELDLMKIKFFTNVSHEFRTPLSLIIAPIEKLIKQSQNPDQEKQFHMIHRNARRLLSLVNQLLDFRKLEVEGIKLHLSEGNLITFIEEGVKSFTDLSEKKNIALSFNSNVKRLQASFDMDKMEKILFNLLSNAFKFTPENGSINVEVNCFDNDSSSEGIKIVELKVSDTGIGIPKEKQDKVFERFFRNDMPGSMVNQGSGIGLSITKEFVKIHGGSVRVESEVGVGSSFIVNVPVKEIVSGDKVYIPPIKANGEQLRTDLPISVHGREAVPGNKKEAVVLLVEDNDDFRFYLKDNLSIHFTIIEAANGVEGWQKALSNMPDLIVSDLMMPEMDGTELCNKIKHDARTSHIPFVLLTANSADEQKLKGLTIGADDYVTKPFNFEILLTRLINIVTQRKLLQKALEKKISVDTSEIEIVSMDDKLIQKAIKIVEENLSNSDFSVEELSKEIGMSRVHLYKKLVALTGKSPVEFIRSIRIQRAAQFLEKSQLSVSEVAYKVGFNNRKYFTKYFKNEFNILPSLYSSSKQKN